MFAKKLDLTTKRNMQFLCIAFLLSIMIIGYGQWVLLQQTKAEYFEQMQFITEYLVRRMPYGYFSDIVARHGAANKSLDAQIMAINTEIQPILNNSVLAGNVMRYGVYSREHRSIVAIGPDFDRSLLVKIDTDKFSDLYNTGQVQSGVDDNSIVWYGAQQLYYQTPIIYDGLIIGHAFANVNLNKVYAQTWKRTVNSLLGVVIGLLVIIILFQETFIRLKRDLRLFAEKIVEGKANDFESELPEFTPILKYISEQTEKMARFERLNIIGEMAASIGHEVRNPMTTVRGYLQFMSNKKEFQGHQKSLLLMIDELDRANSIITEFLSLAKNHVMDFKKNDLNKVITDIAPLLQADAMRNNCQIEFIFGELPDVLLDVKSIRQLILNMVRNGIEAMPQGGTVDIITAQRGGKVLLSIKDQGVGIPAEILSKLGTPFITTKETGTGLGLPVCYRIAQRHEAAILVESQPGKGTIFTIEFNCG